MPGFAQDLGHGIPGVTYALLLAADAAGALVAGLFLEIRGGVMRASTISAFRLSLAWAGALLAFALTRTYALAIPLLFTAGFFELSFSSMAQALVQTNAPDLSRGRVLGLFNMASSGLRTFSGLSVGIAG